MGKSTFSGGIPADLPIEVEPGVTHRERDFFAQESPTRGFMQGFPGSRPDHENKGDRQPYSPSDDRRFPDPQPFKKLRGGKE